MPTLPCCVTLTLCWWQRWCPCNPNAELHLEQVVRKLCSTTLLRRSHRQQLRD